MNSLVVNENNCFEYFKNGRVDGFRYLVKIYHPILLHFTYRFVSLDTQASEEIVMDVLLKSWENNETFKDMDHIRKFLYVSVKNRCLNYLRDSQKDMQKAREFSSFAVTNSEDFLYKEVLHAELMAKVRIAIDALPEKMKEIFILSYIKNLSNQEIADKLNISYQTVSNQKSRSLVMLREQLKDVSILSLLTLLSYLSK